MAYSTLGKTPGLIRRFHLHPAAAESEPIQGHFSVQSLDDDPNYEALSYVWGDPSNASSVEVNGARCSVTPNLHAALTHLRRSSETRILWIDALCIDQSNDEEKMHQVSQMGAIYERATQVVVFLGTGWPGSNLAMDFLKTLGTDATLHLDYQLSPTISVNGLGLAFAELSGNLVRLFELPWWQRTWTVQEFVLAKKLVFQCEQRLVSQDEMYMARENFWNHRDRCCKYGNLDQVLPGSNMSLTTAFTQPAKLDFILKSRGESFSVLSAIAMFSKRAVTDPRDRVYGMLGLGTGPYASLVKPDYTVSSEKVCENVSKRAAELTGTLEFLSHIFPHDNPRLASFVPNWTGQFAWNEIFENRLNHVERFAASLGLPAQLTWISSKTLLTRGILVDTVTAVNQSPFLDFSWDTNILPELRAQVCKDSVPGRSPNEENDAKLITLWHNLCGGMELVLRDSNRFTERMKGKTDLTKFYKLEAFLSASMPQKRELYTTELQHVLLDVETATQGRRFFFTQTGLFGFGPESCRVGDQVVVLAGGAVPYLIRATSWAERARGIFSLFRQGIPFQHAFFAAIKLFWRTFYIMLGDVHVEAIMDGEAFEMLGKTEKDLQEIVLV